MKNFMATFISVILLIFAFNLKAENEEAFELTDAELEQILAPIALYPDSVLTHILIAATYPLEVVQANRWVTKNPDLPPADAMSQVENEEWDPSVKALIPFPTVLQRLSDDLNWTQKLGDAFLQDESRVLDSIQSLRQKADKAGNLSKMENVKIVREQKVIVLEPAEPEIIYVPYYDTRVVYGHWYWDHYPPVYWHSPYYSHHRHGPFYWHSRVHITHGFFFSAFHWHNHHVVVIDRHHYRDRRYYHRNEIIRHSYVNRWEHNPNHRRGVAYRSNQVRERYNDTRPSRIETRAIRNNEREIAVQRQNRNNNERVISANRNNINERQVTRQQRLREQLDERETTRQNVRQDNNNRRVDQQNDNRNVNDRRERNDRQVDRRDIKNDRQENNRRDVVPRQNEGSKESIERNQRQDRREQRNNNQSPPKRENQSRDDNEPPVKRDTQNRQVQTDRQVSRQDVQRNYVQQENRQSERHNSERQTERTTERRSVRSQRTERNNSQSSQKSSRSNRRSDDRR